ncbi:aromatase/cyclase [Streptomyces sp. NPDC041068]|uniref:aromatase/cyclase n=1 Tax=Streptomyces sp. NPDC041068 TaxID=3155130 RepID=UPI0033EFF054
MPRPATLHRVEHTRTVAAPAAALYGLVADVTRWPAVFEPTVAVRHLARGERTERFEIWATVGEEVAHWTSRRTLDPARRYISFRQEHSRPPVTAMSGCWLFRELPDGTTEIVLRHRFSVVDDDPAALDAMTRAMDANSTRELAALARVAESGHPVDDVVFAFTDTVPLTGPAVDAYAFVDRADLWAQRLPHVARADLTEPRPGIQHLEMDTTTADGSTHTTRSTRITEAPGWIAYKQHLTPALLAGHSGEWTFAEGPEGPLATARHTVALAPEAVTDVLGPDATLADARTYIREALGRNSATTLQHAAAVRV